MSYELVSLIVFFLSFTGLVVFVWRKIPLLLTLPSVSLGEKASFVSRLKGKIAEINPLRNFSYLVVLQKILSYLRILALKLENKTTAWLQLVRQKLKEKKMAESDDYWKKLKHSVGFGKKEK